MGEDLDWTVGPSVLAAIEQGITVHATIGRGSEAGVVRSGWPIDESSPLVLRDEAESPPSRLTHVIAAARTFARTAGLDLSQVGLSISSTLPAAAGLSSSAAVILATLQALSSASGLGLDRDEIIALGYHVESEVLRTGAGQMDFYGCARGGVTVLDSSRRPPMVDEDLATADAVHFVVVDTATSRRTGDVIRMKRERWERREADIVAYVGETRRLVDDVVRLLAAPVLDLPRVGRIVSDAHVLLRDRMHSSNELLDECVERLLGIGAYGAKLTGTGHGGCVFGVFPSAVPDAVADAAFADLEVRVMASHLSSSGLTATTDDAALGSTRQSGSRSLDS